MYSFLIDNHNDLIIDLESKNDFYDRLETRPTPMRDRDITTSFKEWLDTYINDEYYYAFNITWEKNGNFMTRGLDINFKSKEDATLFKLTWT